MKKILFASTALVAFAGAAAAEVVITGDGRMGIVNQITASRTGVDRGLPNQIGNVNDLGDGTGPAVTDGTRNAYSNELDTEIGFTSRVRIAFTLTSETDSGVSFGGTIRADNAKGGANGTAGNVFMTGAFGKLSMGDVSGAAEAAVGNLSGVGLTGLGDFNEALYLMQGNNDVLGDNQNEQLSAFALPSALYEYSTGGFTGYIGLGNPAGIELSANGPLAELGYDTIDQAYALGAKYATDAWWVGAGYENLSLQGYAIDDTQTGPYFSDTEISTNFDNWMLGGGGTFAGFTITAQYGQGNVASLDITQYGISVDYTFDATTVTAYWRDIELDDNDDTTDERSRTPFGLGVSYDLGGGAAVKAGVVDPDVQGVDAIWDAGVSFSF